MDKPLTGQVALVTGGSRRTGRDIALALADAGARVQITYLSDRTTAEQTAADLATRQAGARAWRCNSVDEAAVEATIAELLATVGRVDILVNAIGHFLARPIEETTPSEWRTVLEGTATATFIMCRAVLPAMKAQGYGRIINLADAGADLSGPWESVTPYMIGKAGVLTLTKSLAKHCGPFGITVNAVSPGILENSVTKPPIQKVPVGQFTPTEAIARAVLYFAAPTSAHVTGANLKVSGGWHM